MVIDSRTMLVFVREPTDDDANGEPIPRGNILVAGEGLKTFLHDDLWDDIEDFMIVPPPALGLLAFDAATDGTLNEEGCLPGTWRRPTPSELCTVVGGGQLTEVLTMSTALPIKPRVLILNGKRFRITEIESCASCERDREPDEGFVKGNDDRYRCWACAGEFSKKPS